MNPISKNMNLEFGSNIVYSTINFNQPVYDIYVQDLTDPNFAVERQDFIDYEKIPCILMTRNFYEIEAKTARSINQIKTAILTTIKKK